MSLVSIVSPCYNGENYIQRYLDAIIAQTYRPLELVLVNDGSTDKTDEIIQRNADRFESANIPLKYIKKKNEGLGAAINDGLKKTTGDYLIWPDTDDVLFPQSIEKRVRFLKTHPEYGFVTTDGYTFLEDDLQHPQNRIAAIVPANGRMFMNVLTSNVVFTPCGYMLRMSAFLEVNPTKSIFPSRYGQDIQMLLPISRKYRCGHIKEPLYGRVDRKESLSKIVWNESDDAWKRRILGIEEIYVETLKLMGGDALGYIPYIYYKDLRILNSVSRNVSDEEHKTCNAALKNATSMMLQEVLKGLINGK